MLVNLDSKAFFLQRVLESEGKANAAVLELGCGTAPYVRSLMEERPGIRYVGIEPSTQSLAQAVANNEKHIRFYNQNGVDRIPGIDTESFDVVYSLSVLEHVKKLDSFLENSVRYAKPGALIVHRYDLGHALYPSSLKERTQVFLGNHIPRTLPESKFVRYVPLDEVIESLKRHGVTSIEKVTYHQMPNHKTFEKYAKGEEFNDLRAALYEWELEVSPHLMSIDTAVRERLFPSVAVWARK